jgi:tetratricopeptide (TPR) repeat protein
MSTIPLVSLVEQAQQLIDAGQPRQAAGLYRRWLASGPQPLAHAAQFNLGVLLVGLGDAAGAEEAYRDAVTAQPTFVQGWLAMGNLLEQLGRPEEALNCWSLVPGLTDEAAHCLPAFHNMARVLAALGRAPQARAMLRRSLAREPAQPELLQELLVLSKTDAVCGQLETRHAQPGKAAEPLVSILIPTHNRPDYAELALLSALGQTYPSIEIVISDNSDDDATQQRFAPYAAGQPCIRYLRAPGLAALDNFHNCYVHAQGELVNFLMDDDLFHPEKIERMAKHFSDTQIGLVTSFRQQIDASGRGMVSTSPSTARLVESGARINGQALRRHVLLSGLNVIGEPTTVLCRKALLGQAFGFYFERQYRIVPDMAAWLDILHVHDAIYLPEALSYFRVHGNQDQANPVTQARGAVENIRLLCDTFRHAPAPLTAEEWKPLLGARLAQLIGQLPQIAPVLARSGVAPDEVQALVRDTLELLLA